MHEAEREIEGQPDFETGKPRHSSLRYTVSWPDLPAGEAAKGLVIFIPGFGGDADPAYTARLRRHVVEAHGHAVVNADYHCLRARPETGARLGVDREEHIRLYGLARLRGLETGDPNDFAALADAFKGVEPPPQVRGFIALPNGDLQNFGVVQALDHLRVLGDLMERGPAFDPRRVIAFGSSHGGYLAHLTAKFAPGAVAGVIDNSGYVQPPLAYGGGGTAPEYGRRMGGIDLLCRTQRAWSYDERGAPDFYGRDADLIRDVGHPPHLAIQRGAAPEARVRFRMSNAVHDGISPPALKARQAHFLAAAGFDAELKLVGEADLDGRLFKTMTHGLDASLQALADLWLPDWPAAGSGWTGSVDYPCVDQVYRFTRLDRFPYVEASRFDRFPV